MRQQLIEYQQKNCAQSEAPADGKQNIFPLRFQLLYCGKSREKTEAAVMTPAANPRKIRCIAADISFLKKNIIAAPSAVARKVAPVPMSAKTSSLPNIVLCTRKNRVKTPSIFRYTGSEECFKLFCFYSVYHREALLVKEKETGKESRIRLFALAEPFSFFCFWRGR